MDFDLQGLDRTLAAVRRRLMDLRLPGACWEGELSSSALSTATAVGALSLAGGQTHKPLIRGGLEWLAGNVNPDGGWGDTVLSKSNLSTTVLAWSAFALGGETGGDFEAILAAGQAWIARAAGSLEPKALAEAIARRYGKDRTFSVPILTMCALAGRLGPPETAWRLVPPLPFELAACPHRCWRWIHLPVVSYALPALIAIGQAKFHRDPTRNPLVRLVRRATVGRTLRVLQDIQPTGGGFLEAAPLTSFVVMSLAAAGRKDHPVAARGVDFLARSVRPDGSWPIDTNLATWVTTLTVNALAAGGDLASALDEGARRSILDWLLARQAQVEHPYTHAAPGGWAWTDLSGGVLDADDTAGAMIAIRNLSWPGVDERTRSAAAAGVKWLVDLQNRDGGIPTFCRGWGKLPFDRGSPDLTAHALAAWSCWLDELPGPLRARTEAAMRKAVAYLGMAQRPEGAWSALWFGNENAPDEENLTYGTARVLPALGELSRRPASAAGAPIHEMLIGGVRWLLSAQNEDGGWGGAPGVAASIEETALAVDALAEVLLCGESPAADQPLQAQVSSAVIRGVAWLVRNTGSGEAMNPSPIGFYFARLWYFERMYPLVFTVSALGRVRRRHP